MRRKFFDWLVTEVAKVPPNEYLPKWLLCLRRILFPIESYLLMNRAFNYDYCRDVFTLYGQEYSGSLFRAWGNNGFPSGTHFILHRDKYNMLSIEVQIPEDKL